MNRREIVRELRTSGKLKGVKPCIVILKQNIGEIYKGGYANFVMTIKNNETLHFQKLSIFNTLKPKGDFSIDLKDYKEYCLNSESLSNTLYIYSKDKKFIPIQYHKGIADTYQTEDNMYRIIKILEEKGIKELYSEKED